jgi:CBS domain-containing protein
MRKLVCSLGTGVSLALLSPAALGAPQEDAIAFIGKAPYYAFTLFVIIVALGVYFMKLRDKRAVPLSRIYQKRAAIHAVGPDTIVSECVRKMTTENIGALIIMDGEKLVGIFTERDALGKVLAAGLDPGRTKVSMVMTKDPLCVAPTTTVSDAMELITKRRFRHLPVAENGKVLAIISSGDLTHWLVKDQMGEVQELVDLAARS